MCETRIARLRHADRARREHEVVLALREDRAAQEAREDRDVRDADRDHDLRQMPGPSTATIPIASSRPGIASMMSIARMITRVDDAAEVAGDRAEQQPDREPDGDRDDADQERVARAVDDPRELVAAELVDAEPVRARWGRGSTRSGSAVEVLRSVGSYGASSGAKIATMTKTDDDARSRRCAPGLRQQPRARRRSRDRPSAPRATSSLRLELGDAHETPDPRVDDRVRDVDEQVDEHEHDRDEEDAALEHRVVAVEDRVLQPRPDARPGEDRLGEHRAESSRPVWRPMIVDDRQQRVAQHVAPVDDGAAPALWRAPCARSPRSARRAPTRA